jgi:phospholipid/cholesterol/gamma-HCH transport system permease protein
MGVDPVHVLVVPRLIGMIAGLLFLTILGMILGILAGAAVAFIGLDLTWEVYKDRVLEVLSAEDASWVLQGIIKSLAFGATVAIVSCFRGFQVHGGADAVGRAATAAVVESIFMIIAINTIITVLYTMGG